MLLLTSNIDLIRSLPICCANLVCDDGLKLTW